MIDLDQNGITSSDVVIEDAGPHAHQLVYVDVTFPATGDYGFEVRAYNSGGGGSLEVSVSTVTVPVPDDAIESEYGICWESLGPSRRSRSAEMWRSRRMWRRAVTWRFRPR
jgi:hypothetical protein